MSAFEQPPNYPKPQQLAQSATLFWYGWLIKHQNRNYFLASDSVHQTRVPNSTFNQTALSPRSLLQIISDLR
jgi:hypothetical protein